jgi:MarR family transcriptional regulator, organic hydroperoxide resistance regulator
MPNPDRTTKPLQDAANDLVDVVMLAMQAVGAGIRRKSRGKQPSLIEPSQWITLRRIRQGPCTMTDLANYKVVSLPTISKSVDLFVRNGLVERWIDKTDRRQTLVRLTPKGRRILAKGRRESVRILVERIGEVPAGERVQLAAALKSLSKALSTP